MSAGKPSSNMARILAFLDRIAVAVEGLRADAAKGRDEALRAQLEHLLSAAAESGEAFGGFRVIGAGTGADGQPMFRVVKADEYHA